VVHLRIEATRHMSDGETCRLCVSSMIVISRLLEKIRDIFRKNRGSTSRFPGQTRLQYPVDSQRRRVIIFMRG
jgi:hypothetical protein